MLSKKKTGQLHIKIINPILKICFIKLKVLHIEKKSKKILINVIPNDLQVFYIKTIKLKQLLIN